MEGIHREFQGLNGFGPFTATSVTLNLKARSSGASSEIALGDISGGLPLYLRVRYISADDSRVYSWRRNGGVVGD